jgi:hypothetical protein
MNIRNGGKEGPPGKARDRAQAPWRIFAFWSDLVGFDRIECDWIGVGPDFCVIFVQRARAHDQGTAAGCRRGDTSRDERNFLRLKTLWSDEGGKMPPLLDREGICRTWDWGKWRAIINDQSQPTRRETRQRFFPDPWARGKKSDCAKRTRIAPPIQCGA